MTFVVLEMNGDEIPQVIAHRKNIVDANAVREQMYESNPDRIFHVICVPRATK